MQVQHLWRASEARYVICSRCHCRVGLHDDEQEALQLQPGRLNTRHRPRACNEKRHDELWGHVLQDGEDDPDALRW